MGQMEAIKEGLDAWTIESICRGEHGAPFSVLGPQMVGRRIWIRAWLPDAQNVCVIDSDRKVISELAHLDPRGLFCGALPHRHGLKYYRLRVSNSDHTIEIDDPYRFPALLTRDDLINWSTGQHRAPWQVMGAHLTQVEGVDGCRFALWAPNARRVSVVGDFNRWNHSTHAMRLRKEAGVWEIFVPGVSNGDHYRFEIMDWQGRRTQHNDPFARKVVTHPQIHSVVAPVPPIHNISAVVSASTDSAVSIYEVDLATWRQNDDGSVMDWFDLARTLIPYVVALGFTHIGLLPVSENTREGIQGMRGSDRFAPASRFGDPAGLREFVEQAHTAGLGVIMNWQINQFPVDNHGLGNFDGTRLFEHVGPHQDFVHETRRYSFGRPEVSNYLLGSALYWLESFGLDGLRIEGLSSILYSDDTRPAGEWIPNGHSGLENLDAIEFLQVLNRRVAEHKPGAIMVAEEDTSFGGVTRSADYGGLGFSYKVNLHGTLDALHYLRRQPSHRRFHHHEITFGPAAAHADRYLMAVSHRHIGTEQGSLYSKMPGEGEIKFANLRLFMAFMWMHPGKKSLFMGCEFASPIPWEAERALDWQFRSRPEHAGIANLVGALNVLYRQEAALHELDCNASGFEWVCEQDADHALIAFLRNNSKGESILVVCNFSADLRENLRIGVPQPGSWQQILHTEAPEFGGSGKVTKEIIESENEACHARAQSIVLNLAPLSICAYKRQVLTQA